MNSTSKRMVSSRVWSGSYCLLFLVLWACGGSQVGSSTPPGSNPPPNSNPPPGSPTHPYTTTFHNTENPLSESGIWINGAAQGIDWSDCRSTPGLGFGTEPQSVDFNDTTCVMAGTWKATQQAQGTVRVVTSDSATFEEVEIRLRTTISAHSITGYEFNCSVKSGSQYMQIVRWNGALGDFTILKGDSLNGCADGDVIKATISGATITAYKNGTQMLQYTDPSPWNSGTPGLGLYVHGGAIADNSDFGFSSFTASD